MKEATQVVGKTVGVKKKAKVLVGILVAVLGFTAWTWWFYVLHAPERDVQKFFTFWQWRLHSYGLKIAYESDVYGGETPEETVRLYVEALRAGNPELASMYYVPEKRGTMEESFLKGEKNGVLGEYADLIESRDVGRMLDGGVYSYSVIENNEHLFYLRLKFIDATNRWKIIEP